MACVDNGCKAECEQSTTPLGSDCYCVNADCGTGKVCNNGTCSSVPCSADHCDKCDANPAQCETCKSDHFCANDLSKNANCQGGCAPACGATVLTECKCGESTELCSGDKKCLSVVENSTCIPSCTVDSTISCYYGDEVCDILSGKQFTDGACFKCELANCAECSAIDVCIACDSGFEV